LKEIASIQINDLIFLDESGANLQMRPEYGRGKKGKRITTAAPFNRGSKMTMIGAISINCVEAALYGEWAANTEIFLTFITKCLCPVLRKNHVVVMDNVAFHQAAGVKEAIIATGAKLLYLPPYSPELNPIEMMWSKIKNFLRKKSARTLETFQVAIQSAFQDVMPQDLNGWFRHAGYEDQQFWEPL